MRVYTLYNWKFETDRSGYSLYCVGDLYNGWNKRGWETSAVVSMTTKRDGYEIVTQNSIYFLPW
jgi:hypothetical protein